MLISANKYSVEYEIELKLFYFEGWTFQFPLKFPLRFYINESKILHWLMYWTEKSGWALICGNEYIIWEFTVDEIVI